MATITIEDVPDTFVKKVGTSIKFDDFSIVKKRRILTKQKDPTIRLQKLVDDPNNTSYGPMSVDEFISEMKKW
ncbi:hypothetical protein EOM39_05380 [Candidatus Gracilibacteria bacterium]|nr:hypothetical protein [Candidatus Gracilibacteria bacterium]